MKDLYIIGAGGFGREVAWLVERINKVTPTWNIKGFIDDNESLLHSMEDDYEVVGNCHYLEGLDEVYAVCAVGNAQIRKKIIDKLANTNIKFATLIDPSVILSNRVEIGEGSIICAGTILTVDICIGKHVIINLDCTLGHDDIIHFLRREMLDFTAFPVFFVSNLLLVQRKKYYFNRAMVSRNCSIVL